MSGTIAHVGDFHYRAAAQALLNTELPALNEGEAGDDMEIFRRDLRYRMQSVVGLSLGGDRARRGEVESTDRAVEALGGGDFKFPADSEIDGETRAQLPGILEIPSGYLILLRV